MQKNKVTLMGFLGGDAVIRTDKNNEQYTTLTLATTESYKEKETGKYVNFPPEWHDLFVFKNLGKFAATLKKSAHIEIEGRLRYRKYKGVKTASIVVLSILTLDRAEKAAPEDLEHEPELSDDIPF